jgi:hypothetical protein
MQKLTRTLAMAGALAFAGVLAGCGDDVSIAPDPQLDVSPPSATIAVGQSVTISATVTGTTNKAVTWATSDATKASVDGNGKVTGVAAGVATITATATGPQLTKSVLVTVTPVNKGVTKVDISPNTAILKAGDFQQLTANVTRDPGVAGTVTWASSATGVATVDATGKVTAVANGSAIITAASTVDPSVSGTAAITVRPIQLAQISIKAVTQGGTTQPVNFNNVTGQIDVVLNVDPGEERVTKVDVNFDGVSACTRNLSASESDALRMAAAFENVEAVDIVCSINTADFNTTTGAVKFLNGAHVLSASGTIAGPPARTITATDQAITLNNQSGFIATVANTNTNTGFPNSAINPTTGRKWVQGNVTLTLAAVNYTAGGATVTSASGAFLGKAFTATPAAGTQIFTVSFPNSGTGALNIVGYQTAALAETQPVVTSSNLSNGNQGPTTILNQGASADNLGLTRLDSTRVDNVAPAAPTVAGMKTWINGAFAFDSSSTGISNVNDTGVDNVTVEFYAIKGTNPTTACDLTGMTKVANGAALAETLTSLSYQGKVVITDALGNRRCTPLANAWGVDLGAPALDSVRGPSANETFGAANPPAAGDDSIRVFFSDTLSGARQPTPLNLSIKLVTATATSCPVGATTACNQVVSANQVQSRGGVATNGYFTYTVSASDSAGNSTANTTRTFLWDNTAPTQTGAPQQPATYTAGGSATFTVASADNVDLGAPTGILTYAGRDTLEFAGSALGSFGSDAFTTTGTSSFTVNNFIRCMNATNDTTAAGGVKATSYNIVIKDIAGNSTNVGNTTIPAIAVPNCGTVGNSKLAGTGFTVSATPTTVSISGAASVPKTTTIAARVETVASESVQPFSRVDFYVRDAATNRLTLIATSTAPSLGPQGAIRPWTYSFSYTPTTVGTPSIVAIGVDAEGDAMFAAPVTVTVNP